MVRIDRHIRLRRVHPRLWPGRSLTALFLTCLLLAWTAGSTDAKAQIAEAAGRAFAEQVYFMEGEINTRVAGMVR